MLKNVLVQGPGYTKRLFGHWVAYPTLIKITYSKPVKMYALFIKQKVAYCSLDLHITFIVVEGRGSLLFFYHKKSSFIM